MNVINGGAHANNGLQIQEFMIRPDRARSFSEAIRICYIVINNLKKLIIKWVTRRRLVTKVDCTYDKR